MDSRETKTIAFSNGVQRGDPMGPANVLSVVATRAERFREEFEGEGMEAFAYINYDSLDLMEVTANTVGAFSGES